MGKATSGTQGQRSLIREAELALAPRRDADPHVFAVRADKQAESQNQRGRILAPGEIDQGVHSNSILPRHGDKADVMSGATPPSMPIGRIN